MKPYWGKIYCVHLALGNNRFIIDIREYASKIDCVVIEQ